MADLEAEMARFEAELAGVSGAGGAGLSHEAGRFGAAAHNHHPAPGARPDGQSMLAPPVLMPLPPPPFRPQLMGHVPGGALMRPMEHAVPGYPPPMRAQAQPPGFAQQYLPGGAAANYPPPPQHFGAAPAVQAPYAQAGPSYAQQQPAPSTSYFATPAAGPQAAAASAGGAQYAAPAKQYAAPAVSVASFARPAGMSADEAKKAAQATLDGLKAAAGKDGKKKPPAVPRKAGGEVWWDPTLSEWPSNDFRIFVGDMGNEVNDDVLTKAFQKYTSFAKARIVRDKHSNKSKGFGFVSLLDPIEGARALREMNGKYIGNRPCKLRKSNWEERTNEQALRGKRKGAPGGIQATLKKHHGVLHK